MGVIRNCYPNCGGKIEILQMVELFGSFAASVIGKSAFLSK